MQFRITEQIQEDDIKIKKIFFCNLFHFKSVLYVTLIIIEVKYAADVEGNTKYL